MTSNRLLGQDFFKDRVDGWLSLSGGPARHGTARHGTALVYVFPDARDNRLIGAVDGLALGGTSAFAQ